MPRDEAEGAEASGLRREIARLSRELRDGIEELSVLLDRDGPEELRPAARRLVDRLSEPLTELENWAGEGPDGPHDA